MNVVIDLNLEQSSHGFIDWIEFTRARHIQPVKATSPPAFEGSIPACKAGGSIKPWVERGFARGTLGLSRKPNASPFIELATALWKLIVHTY